MSKRVTINEAYVGSSCGRYYLDVNGIVAATQGDPCRDENVVNVYDPDEYLHGSERFGAKVWTFERLHYARQQINRSPWRRIFFWRKQAEVLGVRDE